MPGDEQDILLRTLVTRFSLDPQSVQQVIDDTRSAKEREKQIIVEEERLIRQELTASAELKRNKELRELEETERSLQRHYDRRRELAHENLEELRRIEAAHIQDQMTLDQRRQALTGGDGEQPGGGGGFMGIAGAESALGRLRNAVTTILPGIGLGFLTGAASVGFFVRELSQAADRMRVIDSLARGQMFAAGQFGTGFQPGFSEQLRAIRNETMRGRTVEQISDVASIFTPILAGRGEEGAAQMGGLTRQAIGLGAAYGVNEKDVGRIMVAMRRIEEIPVAQLASRFNELGNRAFRAGMTVSEYAGHVQTLTENTKRYNIGFSENERIVDMFSRELQQGLVTIQDLVRLQTGMATAPPGQRAFWVQQALQRGFLPENLARELEPLAGNAAALEQRARELYSDPTQPDAGRMISAGVALSIREFAREMAANEAPDRQALMIRRHEETLARGAGLITGDLAPQQVQAVLDAMAGMRGVSPGALKGAKGFADPSDAIDSGLSALRESVGWQEKIKLGIDNVHEDLLQVIKYFTNPDEFRAQTATGMAATFSNLVSLGPNASEEQVESGVAALMKYARRDPARFYEAMGTLGIEPARLSPAEANLRNLGSAFTQGLTGGGRALIPTAGDVELERTIKLIVENRAGIAVRLGEGGAANTPFAYEEREGGGNP